MGWQNRLLNSDDSLNASRSDTSEGGPRPLFLQRARGPKDTLFHSRQRQLHQDDHHNPSHPDQEDQHYHHGRRLCSRGTLTYNVRSLSYLIAGEVVELSAIAVSAFELVL